MGGRYPTKIRTDPKRPTVAEILRLSVESVVFPRYCDVECTFQRDTLGSYSRGYCGPISTFVCPKSPPGCLATAKP